MDEDYMLLTEDEIINDLREVFETICENTSSKLRVQGYELCIYCKGLGKINTNNIFNELFNSSDEEICRKCKGKGHIDKPLQKDKK